MEEKMIPFYAHEAETTRLERIIKRLWILCIIIFIAFVGSNCAWLYYESQFEDLVVDQDVDTGEGSAIVNGTGDIYYGESKAED